MELDKWAIQALREYALKADLFYKRRRMMPRDEHKDNRMVSKPILNSNV